MTLELKYQFFMHQQLYTFFSSLFLEQCIVFIYIIFHTKNSRILDAVTAREHVTILYYTNLDIGRHVDQQQLDAGGGCVLLLVISEVSHGW